MNIKDIHVFTDADLDGAISYLTLCWFFGQELPVTTSTSKDVEKDLDIFFKQNDINKFRRIYILDMDICNFAKKLDHKNFTIVDHHQGSINCGYNFQNARFRIKDEGSTCKLLYNVLKEHYKKDLNEKQKMLIALGHDYDSYSLNFKELSIGLNMLFWNLQGNRLQKFVKKFYSGFEKFSNEDNRIINYYNNKIDRYLLDNCVYTAQIEMGGRPVKLCSIFADICVNEIAQRIINKTKSDIGIVVNLNSGSVSFRRSKSSDIDVSKLAGKIADGGGHVAAAGGRLTENFTQFTKLFKPYD